jgi:hypothetical protein
MLIVSPYIIPLDNEEFHILRPRVIAQEVSRWFPRSGHVGFVVDKVALWQFLS